LGQANTPADLNRVREGMKAPDFQVLDARGKTVTLADFQGKTLVVVFHRGAGSPYCAAQIAELNTLIPDGHKADTVVIGIGPDPPGRIIEMTAQLAAQTGQPVSVVLLADPEHRAIDNYGLRDMEASRMGRYLPHPTTFVIDREGMVRWKFTNLNPRVRPGNPQIRRELGKIW
jgi:peroxiredoxin Q/BCP